MDSATGSMWTTFIMFGAIILIFYFLIIRPQKKRDKEAQAMIDARVNQNITQKELSARTGITQADISRIENGTRNPSLEMVKRIAAGLGMQLKLEFIPTPTKH